MRRACLFVVAAFVVGCSSSSDGTSSTEDSSTPIDSSSDEGVIDSSTSETSSEVATDAPGESSSETSDASDGGVCNEVPVPPTVDEVSVASDPPTLTGGTIADGTWQLVSSQKFTGVGGASGPDGIKIGQTIVVSGASMQSVATAFGASARWNGDYSLGGSDLAVKPTCGTILGAGSSTVVFKYAASTTELQILIEAQGILETFNPK